MNKFFMDRKELLRELNATIPLDRHEGVRMVRVAHWTSVIIIKALLCAGKWRVFFPNIVHVFD